METINIPIEEYEELLKKAKQLQELQKHELTENKTEEIKEDDFNKLEVNPEYLEKLEKIKKGKYTRYEYVDELPSDLKEDIKILERESDEDLANWEKKYLATE